MRNSFERPTANPEGAGAMANRAAWLWKKMKSGPEARGLKVVAESSVARILGMHYPEVETIDSGLESLGLHIQTKIAGIVDRQNLTLDPWVIVATRTGVFIYEVETGGFLSNNASVWLDSSWQNGEYPFDKTSQKYAKQIRSTNQDGEETPSQEIS